MPVPVRRLLFAALVTATVAGLATWLALVLAPTVGSSVVPLMVAALTVKAAWVAINFWNAAIGFVLLQRNASIAPDLTPPTADAMTGRVAVVMTERNESTSAVIARLRAMAACLNATTHGAHFDYWLLSDTSDADIAAAEERAIETWRAATPHPGRIFYRRRTRNDGAQHGNLYDFCWMHGAGYDIMIPLDADSLMSAQAIIELVSWMEANPRVGILQAVNSAVLPPSLFARIFEFGHRHSMRCCVAGAAWWQAGRGQYRGHNAAIRVAAFVKHGRLAGLPGPVPFGGITFCHDQIESMLMHGAGYEVRELSRETGSWEGLPPTLPDQLLRYCRWFQGNLNNLRLLRSPGLSAMDAYHLIGVAHRFLAWPSMVVFAALAILVALVPSERPAPSGGPAVAFMAVFAILYIAPRVLGLINSALSGAHRYGGVIWLAIGGVLDALLTVLLVPLAMLTATLFIGGLAAGRKLPWSTQERAFYRLSWRVAGRQLWPQTVVAIAVLASLPDAAPSALPWLVPFLAGPALAIPLSVLTASPGLGRLALRLGICALPEELNEPAEIAIVRRLEATPDEADAIMC